MHQALYRKWRPKTFSEVCGQEHITSILKQEAALGKFNHAYLFCGSRGTGKTSCAKILAKVANCENVVNGDPCGVCPSCLAVENAATTDILEMDAASNNGVEHIRDIRDEVMYTPSLLKYRVYIVDEVHMLSNQAFNALLKTLEEPPSHAIFILATTELHKLPATIVSRCQRFEFRRIATEALSSRVKYIAKNEGIEIDDDAAWLISRYSQGGMRDAISLLELCASGGKKIDVSTVNEMIGSAGREAMMSVAAAIADKDFDFLFEQIDSVIASSKDIVVFWQDLISLYRDLLVIKTVKDSARYLDLSDYESQNLGKLAERFSKEMLIYYCKMLEEALYAMHKSGSVKRIIAEMCFVKMCDDSLSATNESLMLRLSRLEARVAEGNIAPAPVPQSSKPEKETAAKAEPATKKEPVAKAEPAHEKTQKKEPPTKENGVTDKADPSKKPLKIWPEIIQGIKDSDKGVYVFLRRGRAYQREDGRIRVVVESFALGTVDNPKVKGLLAAAFSQHLGRSYSHDDIIYEIGNATPPEESGDLDDDLFNMI